MPASSPTQLEIVELSNGEVVLRTKDGDHRALVTIRFSDEARNFLGSSIGQIGKAMIGTGVQLVGEIYESEEIPAEDLDSARVLH